MRVFVQKQAEQSSLPSSFSFSSRTAVASHEPRDLILSLQRTVGNRMVQRLLGAHAQVPFRSSPGVPPDGVNNSAMSGNRLLASDLTRLNEQRSAKDHMLADSPATIMRQKSGPAKKGDEPKPESKPADREKLTKALCVNEPIDDAHARCQFTAEQSSVVRIIKEHALRRCTRAISAINMPGNEGQVKKLARDYFNLNVKMSEKTKKAFVRNIQSVADKLS